MDYARWVDDTHLPIECLINVVLLHRNVRKVVQLDITYYDEMATQRRIDDFVRALQAHPEGVVVRHDHSGNIVLYLARNARALERTLLSISTDGTVEGGFQTSAFSELLDGQFYTCARTIRSVLARPNATRVSIDVIHGPNKVGALLVQMCDTLTASDLARIHRRFRAIGRVLEAVDPTLQTALTVYTKPGLWKESAEYVTRQLHTLPP